MQTVLIDKTMIYPSCEGTTLTIAGDTLGVKVSGLIVTLPPDV